MDNPNLSALEFRPVLSGSHYERISSFSVLMYFVGTHGQISPKLNAHVMLPFCLYHRIKEEGYEPLFILLRATAE